MHSKEFIEEMKQKLLSEQHRLIDELSGLSPHTEMGSNEDDGALELEVDEASQSIILRLQDDLNKIAIALNNIEQGRYGIDAEGNEISEDRLRVLPWADTSV